MLTERFTTVAWQLSCEYVRSLVASGDRPPVHETVDEDDDDHPTRSGSDDDGIEE